MKIKIVNKTNNEVDTKVLEELFSKIENNKTLAIILVDLNQIQELNKTYRNIEAPTDVLSFEADEVLKEDLGDIFICYEKVISQAKTYNHSINREFCFLAVHGYLHLLGHDHRSAEEENQMMQKPEELLKIVNLNKEKKSV